MTRRDVGYRRINNEFTSRDTTASAYTLRPPPRANQLGLPLTSLTGAVLCAICTHPLLDSVFYVILNGPILRILCLYCFVFLSLYPHLIVGETFIQMYTGLFICNKTWVGLTLIWKFHTLAQLRSRFCQIPSRIGQTVEQLKSKSTHSRTQSR